MTRYYDINQIAHYTGVSVANLRKGVRTGRFTYIRLGNNPRGKLMFDLRDEALVLATEAQVIMTKYES